MNVRHQSFFLTTIVCVLAAQSHPNRPIQLVILNVAGSIVDMNARALADKLGKPSGHRLFR